jgi:hypothetical protein
VHAPQKKGGEAGEFEQQQGEVQGESPPKQCGADKIGALSLSDDGLPQPFGPASRGEFGDQQL